MVLDRGRVWPPTTIGNNSLPVDVPFADEYRLILSPGDTLLRIVESERRSSAHHEFVACIMLCPDGELYLLNWKGVAC